MRVDETKTKRGPGRPRLPEYRKVRTRLGRVEDTMRAVVPQVLDSKQSDKLIQLIIDELTKEAI